MSAASIKVAELLIVIASAIPTVGPALAAGFESIKLILEIIKDAKSPPTKLIDFAVRCADLALDIRDQMAGRWETMSNPVRLRLEAIQSFLEAVAKVYVRQSRMTKFERLLQRAKPSQNSKTEIADLESTLNRLQNDFNSIILLDVRGAISDMHPVFQATLRNVKGTTASSHQNETPVIKSEIEEIAMAESLEIYRWKDIQISGGPLLQIYEKRDCGHSCCVARVYAAENPRTKERLLIKTWFGKNQNQIYKDFLGDLTARVQTRSSDLLQLTGVVHARSQMAQVYHSLDPNPQITLKSWFDSLSKSSDESAFHCVKKVTNFIAQFNEMIRTRSIGVKNDQTTFNRFADLNQVMRNSLLVSSTSSADDYNIMYFGNLVTSSKQLNRVSDRLNRLLFYRRFAFQIELWTRGESSRGALVYSRPVHYLFAGLEASFYSANETDAFHASTYESLLSEGWMVESNWAVDTGPTTLKLGDIYIEDKLGNIDVLGNIHGELKDVAGMRYVSEVTCEEKSIFMKSNRSNNSFLRFDVFANDWKVHCYQHYRSARFALKYLYKHGEAILRHWNRKEDVNDLSIVVRTEWSSSISIKTLESRSSTNLFVRIFDPYHPNQVSLDVSDSGTSIYAKVCRPTRQQPRGSTASCTWNLRQFKCRCSSVSLPRLNQTSFPWRRPMKMALESGYIRRSHFGAKFHEILNCFHQSVDYYFMDSRLYLPQERDRDLLQLLYKVEFVTTSTTEPTGFQLSFYFYPNRWFNNESLTAIFSQRHNLMVPNQQLSYASLSQLHGPRQIRRLHGSDRAGCVPGRFTESFFNLFYQFSETDVEELYVEDDLKTSVSRYIWGCKLAMVIGKLHRGGINAYFGREEGMDIDALASQYWALSKSPKEFYDAWTPEREWHPSDFVADVDSDDSQSTRTLEQCSECSEDE